MKKYYWLKLQKDFFKDPRIKKLRRIAGGDTYTLIYLELMLLSLETDGILTYEGIEPTFEAELSLIIDEDETNIKVVLDFLTSQGLMEQFENKFSLRQVLTLIGSECDSAERVRKLREKKKEQEALQCNNEVTSSNENVTTEIRDRERDKREEKEEANASTRAREKNPKNEKFSFTLSKVCKFQNLSQEYQAKLKAKIDEYVRTNSHAMSYEDFENICIAKGYQYQDFNRAYLNWVKKDSNQKQGCCDVVDCEFIPEATQAPRFDDDYFAEIARSQYGC